MICNKKGHIYIYIDINISPQSILVKHLDSDIEHIVKNVSLI